MHWWSHGHMFVCFDAYMFLQAWLLTYLNALIIICSYAHMFDYSHTHMFWWSYALMLTCHDNHMILCWNALMITCSHTHMLWWSYTPMLTWFDLSCSLALIFTCLISTHMYTLGLWFDYILGCLSEHAIGRSCGQMLWRLCLNAGVMG